MSAHEKPVIGSNVSAVGLRASVAVLALVARGVRPQTCPMTTLLLIAVVAAVGAGTYDIFAPQGDRAQFRSAVARARHSLTDWDASREGSRRLPW